MPPSDEPRKAFAEKVAVFAKHKASVEAEVMRLKHQLTVELQDRQRREYPTDEEANESEAEYEASKKRVFSEIERLGRPLEAERMQIVAYLHDHALHAAPAPGDKGIEVLAREVEAGDVRSKREAMVWARYLELEGYQAGVRRDRQEAWGVYAVIGSEPVCKDIFAMAEVDLEKLLSACEDCDVRGYSMFPRWFKKAKGG